jgi:hypothetical protein
MVWTRLVFPSVPSTLHPTRGVAATVEPRGCTVGTHGSWHARMRARHGSMHGGPGAQRRLAQPRRSSMFARRCGGAVADRRAHWADEVFRVGSGFGLAPSGCDAQGRAVGRADGSTQTHVQCAHGRMHGFGAADPTLCESKPSRLIAAPRALRFVLSSAGWRVCQAAHGARRPRPAVCAAGAGA